MGDYRSWVPAWKSPTALPEPVDLDSVLLEQWLLEWKREFVRQIGRGCFEMEQFRVHLRAPTGLGISSKREKREGYYQRYWLHEVSEDHLETRDEWDRNSTLSKVQAIYKDSSNCFISAFSFRQYWPVTMQKRQSWHGPHRSDALWRFGRWGKRLQAPLLIGTCIGTCILSPLENATALNSVSLSWIYYSTTVLSTSDQGYQSDSCTS